MQQGPPDSADDILAGIVDLHALTEDRVRQVGYAPFIAEGLTDEFTEQRFGDRVIIRLRLPETAAPDTAAPDAAPGDDASHDGEAAGDDAAADATEGDDTGDGSAAAESDETTEGGDDDR